MSSNSVLQAPPLPEIYDGDILLSVCTHKDLKPNAPCGWADSERLAVLGAQTLDCVVTAHLFSKQPPARAEEIRTWREHHTSPATIKSWVDHYQLKSKFSVPPERRDTIYNDLEQMASFFHSYVGGLVVTQGQDAVQTWISRLIDPDVNVELLNQGRPTTGTSSASNSRHSSSSHGAQTATATANLPPVSVALVNEKAAQAGATINYISTSTGQSHQPTWTVRCFVNNIERGVGEAATSKAAKEVAARRTWVAMGW